MKFLVDAQLPHRLAKELIVHGHDTKHTIDLSSGNRTKDEEINALAAREDRIVVTKDSDFVTSH
jgi:predicted nuclease of predicted toxin-antitoxin system